MSKTYIEYILLMLMPAICYISLGAVGGYYTYFIMQFLLFTFYGFKRVSLDSLILAISVIFLIAIVVGFINLVFGLNDFKNYIIYSLMSVSYIFAILAGKYFSYKSFKDGLLLLAILAIGELLLVIPRILVIGLDIRTSLGFTYLLPCLFFFLKANKKGFLVFILSSFLYFLAIFLSGLRSVLIPGVVIYLISLIYFYKTFDENNKVVSKFNKFLFLIPLIFILSIGLNLDIFKIKDRIYNATNIVVVRMEQTLLNPDGVRLDPNEGRQEESQFALDTFKDSANVLNYFIGMGYGFSYLDYSKGGELTAHVHITPVAYFLRHGILSFLLYLILFLGVLRSFLSDKMNFSLKFSLFIWLLSSFFAGVLIMPIFWFFWSFILYSTQRKV